MKVMVRELIQVVPGKMDEAMECLKREKACWDRLGGAPDVKMYSPFCRVGDRGATIVFYAEMDSLADMERGVLAGGSDPEMQQIYKDWKKITAHHEIELYVPMQHPS